MPHKKPASSIAALCRGNFTLPQNNTKNEFPKKVSEDRGPIMGVQVKRHPITIRHFANFWSGLQSNVVKK